MSININKDAVVLPSQAPQDADTPAPKTKHGRVIMNSTVKRVVLGTVALGLTAALAACGTTTVTQDPNAAPVAPPTTAGVTPPPPAAASAPAPTEDKPAGLARIELGKPLTITQHGVDAGTVAVTKIEKMTGKQAKAINQFNDDPKHGIYWTVTLSYQGIKDGFTPTSWDWKVKDEQGQTYDEAFLSNNKPALSSSALHAGEKATGTVTYDAPTSGARLVFQPMFSGASLGEMPLT